MLLNTRREAARALAERLERCHKVPVTIAPPLRAPASGDCEWVLHLPRRLEVEVVGVREFVFGFRRYDYKRSDEDGWFGTTEDLADVAATLKYRTVGSR